MELEVKLTLPPEIVDEIVSRLFEKIKPLLPVNDNQDDNLLDVEAVVKYTGLKESWIYQRSYNGTLPFPVIKTGKYLKFRRSDIDKWLKKAEKKGSAPILQKSSKGVRRLLD